MNFEYVDNIYRSRLTLLSILEERGYDVEQYRKFSPAEISVAVEAFPGLSFSVKKKANPEYNNPESKQNDRYMKMICNVMSGSTVEEQQSNLQKVIKNVTKEVIIDKNIENNQC